MFGMYKMDESASVSNTQMGLLIDDSTKVTSANVSMNFLDQGVQMQVLRPGPVPPISARTSHRRKRSRYDEAEIHTTEMTVEEEERPSARLEKSPTLN